MQNLIKAVLVLAAAATFATAADKPNFNGIWKLDASKSNLGPMPALASMTRKVEYHDPDLTITEERTGGPRGDQSGTMKFTTDGKETTINLFGADAKAAAAWEGDALVIKLKASVQGNDLSLIQKWTLSDDGATLTDDWHVAAPQGEFDMVYVLTRQ
ncbi:MAG: hypothetical protein ABSB35_15895 [Bryobacteraceae bacterium]|jgi:hypothetical protein